MDFLKSVHTSHMCIHTYIFHCAIYRCWIPGAVPKTLSLEAVSLWTATLTGEQSFQNINR